jgi:hypothetical protein
MSEHDSREIHFSGTAVLHPHTRAELLSEVSTDGVLALTRALRDADRGDETAAVVPVSALLRALPGVGPLTAHELLRLAHVREDQRVCDLYADQRGVLLQIMSRLARTPLGRS